MFIVYCPIIRYFGIHDAEFYKQPFPGLDPPSLWGYGSLLPIYVFGFGRFDPA
ncbi:MAG: hypothetical protein QM523_10620 [Candidatus Pacebacteria bacterium]|nr:hypothetical protein [Candidatus Paceibacterota bacterium]